MSFLLFLERHVRGPVIPIVRRPAFSRCGREWLGVGGCVAGWIEARQAHEVDFSGCSRKNDGHELKARQV